MKAKVMLCLMAVAGFLMFCAAWGITGFSGAALADPPPHNHGDIDFPVTLVLRDDPNDPNDPNDPFDGIFSDGGPYVDGTDGVSIRFRDTRLLFNIGGTRSLGLDFSDPVEAFPPTCEPDCNKDFVVTNTGDSPGAAGNIQAVDDFGDVLSGGLLGMSVDDPRRGMMMLNWGGSASGKEPRWSVRFKKTTSDPIDTSISNKSTFFEITRTGQDTWIIEAIEPSVFPDTGDRALLWSRTGNGKSRTDLDEGTYHMRFSMTVTRAPSGGGGGALSGTLFLRGDCNADGGVDISDATCALNWLFAGAPEPGCIAALNTNGDEDVNIADPVFLLNFLFAGGPRLSAPFPDCGPGTLPADTTLGCANPSNCQ